jgi:hypothetical protein
VVVVVGEVERGFEFPRATCCCELVISKCSHIRSSTVQFRLVATTLGNIRLFETITEQRIITSLGLCRTNPLRFFLSWASCHGKDHGGSGDCVPPALYPVMNWPIGDHMNALHQDNELQYAGLQACISWRDQFSLTDWGHDACR